jgi:hypothetical protein
LPKIPQYCPKESVPVLPDPHKWVVCEHLRKKTKANNDAYRLQFTCVTSRQLFSLKKKIDQRHLALRSYHTLTKTKIETEISLKSLFY